jgi:hypothetical protein
MNQGNRKWNIVKTMSTTVIEQSKKAMPHNIQEFNAIAGAILAKVYESHPSPRTIAVDDVATALGRKPDEQMPSGKQFIEMFAHTLHWLATNDFINDFAAVTPHRCTLTARGLATLNEVPSSLNGATRGSEIADAARAGGFEKLADIAGGFMGSFAGSFTKTMSGPG